VLLGGTISGAHSLTKAGFGALQLSAVNTFSGALIINAGLMEASGNSSLGAGDGTPGTGTSVASGAMLKVSAATIPNERLDLQGDGGGIGALYGNGTTGWNGPIALSSASMISAGGAFTIGGVISGPFGLVLSGGNPGITLSGTSTYSGTTTVTNGWVFVTGSLSGTSGVDIGGTGILAGTGTVNANVSATGNIAPGHSPGILTTQSVAMVPGADLVSELNGPTAGVQYDQLAVNGTVNLGGADLNLQLGFVPSAGQQFLIVNNDGADPVTGTFNGLSEGAPFTWNGSPFTISYLGGDGNDIVLTAGGAAVPDMSALQLLALGTLLTSVTVWHVRRRSFASNRRG
jgi:autotransporter-associated beta strand protein